MRTQNVDTQATWQNPRVLLILFVVFLCGAVSGAAVSEAVSRFVLHPTVARSVGPYWKEGGKTISLQNLKKELNLTPKQAEEIELVLDDFVMYYQTLQSQMDEVRANGKTRIMKVLDEEQKRKFDAMLDQWQQKMH